MHSSRIRISSSSLTVISALIRLQDLARTVWVEAPELPRFITIRREAYNSLIYDVVASLTHSF